MGYLLQQRFRGKVTLWTRSPEVTVGKHSAEDGADSHPLVAWALSDREVPFGGYTSNARGSAPGDPGSDGPVGWPGRDDERETSGVGWPVSDGSASVPGAPANSTRSPLAQALAAELAAPPREHAEESTGSATSIDLLTAAPRKGWRRFFGGAA